MRGSLGLIVNPVAGMGGKVGLKGTDGATLAAALERGAEPVAAGRALRSLERLKPARDGLRLVTWAGAMGGAVADRAGLKAEVVGGEAGTATSAADTREAAAAMRDCALVLFAGGDGTARDVHDALGGEVPVLGIPTGVKMHSAVFATSPGAAGELASAWLAGDARPSACARPRSWTWTRPPFARGRVRPGSTATRASRSRATWCRVPRPRSFVPDEAALDGLAGEVAAEMEPGRLYILGPGTTTRRVLERLGLRGTLLGVDAVRDRRLVGADLGEAGLLALLEGGGPATIVVGVTGGQGFLFGRGNQAISAEVIRRVGRDSITVLAGAEKLAALDPRLPQGGHGRPRGRPAARGLRPGADGPGPGERDARGGVTREGGRGGEREARDAPLHAELGARHQGGDAGRGRGGERGGALRPDPGRPPPEGAAAPAAGAAGRGRAEAPPRGPAGPERDLRDQPQLPRRRLLAAPRAGGVSTRSSGRSEFLTNVWGTASSDHGRNQAWFEYASQLGELVGIDLVGLPVYSWGCAAGHAIRMASRLTGRREVLVPRAI